MDTHNAFQDIISNDRYLGALSSIESIVKVSDRIFIMIITFCGFFIISIAFLKSVLIALYCSYPRLFDNIAEIKRNMQESKGKSPAGLFLFILSLFIPNVKALVDDDDELGFDMKTTAIKTITYGICMVMLGTVIYNGIYRDALGKFSEWGAYLCTNYFLKIDLIGKTDEILEQGKNYDFSYGGDKQTNAVGKVAESVYNKLRDYYGDIISENHRWTLGQNVENWVTARLNGQSSDFEGYATVYSMMGDDNFTLKYQADITVEDAGSSVKTATKSAQYIFTCPTRELAGEITTKSPEDDTSYVRLVLYFSRKEKGFSGALAPVDVSGTIIYNNSTNETTITLPINGDDGMAVPSQITMDGELYKHDGATTTDKAKFVFSGKAKNYTSFSTSSAESSPSKTVTNYSYNGANTNVYLVQSDSTSHLGVRIRSKGGSFLSSVSKSDLKLASQTSEEETTSE
ncbi:MAG: hypothetical protein IJ736_01130 [Firmicutes bacterium]|nr:hypothetical protein [Bacillota bacterium]